MKKIEKEKLTKQNKQVKKSDAELLKSADKKEKAKKAKVKQQKEVKKNIKKQVKKSEPKKPVVKSSHSKNYLKAKSAIELGKKYPISDALDLVLKISTTKFKSAIEIHFNLNIEGKNEKNIRFTTTLPNPIKLDKKIAVVAETPEEAKKSGADIFGGADLVEKILKGKVDFDILITEPKAMKFLSKLAKILGPKGQMPNEKNGTLTQNLKSTVDEFKKGKMEIKSDNSSNVHLKVGMIDWDKKKTEENINFIIEQVKAHKPSGVKKQYIKSIVICTTMGPGIKLIS